MMAVVYQRCSGEGKGWNLSVNNLFYEVTLVLHFLVDANRSMMVPFGPHAAPFGHMPLKLHLGDTLMFPFIFQLFAFNICTKDTYIALIIA